MTRRDTDPSEDEIQVAFFQWWNIFARQHKLPEQLCFAVPNGGHRHPAVAAKLKAGGVKAGVADVFLEIPGGGFHGLRLEFKTRTGRISDSQHAFMDGVRRRGFNGQFVRSTEEAIHIVRVHLSDAEYPEDRVPYPNPASLTTAKGGRRLAPT